ncbi:MAG TPA: hypothetical protein VJ735_21455 [Actinomycetes bacterium]|nr:hypothetical protein [Actinomycetes bacterium]
MAHVDPDQEAALRRLRAAFGFIEVLEIIDHEASEDFDRDQELEGEEDDDQGPSHRERVGSARRRLLDPPEHDPLVLMWQGPDQLIASDPTGMVDGCVGFQVPWEDHPPSQPARGRVWRPCGTGHFGGCRWP